MNSNRLKGTVNQFKGAAKEAAGKVLGNPDLELEGREQKLTGQVQQAVGAVLDSLED
jgi:uncharacterized protein YjbJ (UPF0337 family)